MAIDKALYEAPQGLEALAAQEPAIEVIIEDLSIDAGPLDIHLGDENPPDFNENLADTLPESYLASLTSELLDDYDSDLSSRKEWLDTYVKGLKLLGLKYENRTEPWPGASGVFHPLLMESAVKFQSEMIMETFPAEGPVRAKIIGKETPAKKEAAVRVQDDMNYTLTEGMPEYRPEHERALLTMATAGNAFKKIYYDPSVNRPVASFIPPEDIIVPYGAVNIESADRVTHRMRKTKNELRKLQVAGFYSDVDLGDPVQVMDEVEKQKATEQGFSATMDSRFQLLEMHVNLNLEGYEDKDKDGEETGIALPYVVTIEKGTSTVLAIRRNWLEEDSFKLRRQHFVHYGYIPGFGFYYFGLIHLIGGHTYTATSLLRQLIDAGTLSNLPGGLKSRGLRVKGDDTPIAPGEFRDVDLPSGAIRDNILMLPYKEPSQVLMALMDKVVQDGRQFAATAELNVSDMSAQAPVGTTLAILERVLKVMSAVQARVHYTMKQEFKLLAAIIRDNTPEDYDYEPEVGNAAAKRSDYDKVDVLPVSDPNASTMAQRVVQYQAVIQLAQGAPQIYDLPFLHRQMIETLGIKNVQKIIPMREDAKPMDPVSENMAVLVGKPVKAFLFQDHDSHLAVHMAAIQDPKIAQIMGQNPQAQMIMGAAMAHVMEHVAMKYRMEIEKQLGVPLPIPPKAALPGKDETDSDEGHMPPQVEVELSALMAQAAGKLLQKDQAEAQQQQAQQQQQDPLVQMQQQELQIKQQQLQIEQQALQLKAQQAQTEAQIAQAEQTRKANKDVMDAASRADELEFKKQELEVMSQLEGAKLGADIQHKRMSQLTQTAVQADRIRLDATKHAADMSHKTTTHDLDKAKHELSAVNAGVDIAHRRAQHKLDQDDLQHQMEMARAPQQEPPVEGSNEE
ncbi:MAG: hypothetical protein EBY29_03320 [Planctomycetes bacterium]|nr:hypothetical protein [Planctomycetota bacterium]